MKLNKATITVMIVTCNATKSGKGYLLSVLQGENHLKIFSKNPIPATVPGVTDITVDINCYVDRSTGEFKEFISVTE